MSDLSSKTYKSEQDAVAYLEKNKFVWNDSTKLWERFQNGINMRCHVGQCRDGAWLITRA